MNLTASFDSMLPRLLAAYDRGALVPFVGAGISTPNCMLWPQFVEGLEREAGIVPHATAKASDQALIQRSARAVRKLKHDRRNDFAAVVGRALANPASPTRDCPAGSRALAQIWWPLVITTNYDHWFYEAWNRAWAADTRRRQIERMEVCGRSQSDCERVLNSLRAPDNPLLWAIQGFLGDFAAKSAYLSDVPADRWEDLSRQLVVGHEEYRREAHRSIGFRRTFSEVFRSRSLLFFGSGLSEAYFQTLFEEVLELQGTLPHLHYAFVKEGTVDTHFLRDRFQIESLVYKEHKEASEWMHKLGAAIKTRSARAASWGIQVGQNDSAFSASADLQVRRGVVPKPEDGECLLFSASVTGLYPSYRHYVTRTLEAFFGHPTPQADLCDPRAKPKIWRFGQLPAFVVAARAEDASGYEVRDTRAVFDATETALDHALAAGFHTVHAVLLAAGKTSFFLPHVSLIQMVRAVSSWKKKRQNGAARARMQLIISTVDPWPIHLLASGRLNLSEILAVREVRIWVEIWRTSSDVLRYLEIVGPDTPLRELLEKYDLPDAGWRASIIPRPTYMAKDIPAQEIMASTAAEPLTINSAGLMPGSMLRIQPRHVREEISPPLYDMK